MTGNSLILIPVALSYTGVGKKCAERASHGAKSMEDMHWFWRFLLSFTKKGPAITAIILSVLMAIGGFYVSKDLQIGDLDPGAPELRADSRYNKDTHVVVSEFSIGVDVITVFAEAAPDACVDFQVMSAIDDFAWHMQNVPGVQSAVNLAGIAGRPPDWLRTHLTGRRHTEYRRCPRRMSPPRQSQ